VIRSSRSRWLRFALPAAAFALALLVRALPYPTVFTPAGVFPDGPDAYYHLRRIAFSVASFPRVLEFDPYLAFPDGGRPIWPPLFDFSLAALARAVLGAQPGPALERWLMWAPPLLGAVCVMAVHALARRAWGARAAALAAFVLAVLPAHFVYSQLGALDHHVAAALAVTCVLAAGLALLRRAGGAARSLVVGALWLGAAQALALLLWPGCLLGVASVGAALAVCVVASARPAEAVGLARSSALAHAFACALVLAFARGGAGERWGALSPVVLSGFQPLFLSAAALCFAALGEVLQRFPLAGSRVRRAVAALGIGALVLAVTLAALPGLLSGAGDALGWLTKSEEFQASVAESSPLLMGAHGMQTGAAVQLFSRIFYALPLLLVTVAFAGRGGEDLRARRVLSGWTLVWLAAALVQRRFVNELSVGFALVVALCALDLAASARRRLAQRGAATKLGAAIVAAAAGAWLLAPVASFYAPYVANLRRASQGEPVRLSGWQPEQRGLTQVARWLAAHTPPTSGYHAATGTPEYGVLAAWGDGHVLRWVAERPVVQDNFGDDVSERGFRLAEEYFSATNEAAALAILDDLRVRYVVVRGAGSGHAQRYAPYSLLKRLHKLGGSEGRPDGADATSPEPLPALARHRLLYDARAQGGADDGSRPSYKIFEIVPGARLAGRAAPRAEVRVELRLALAQRGRLLYRASTRAGADGSWELVVPYANDPAPAADADVRAARAYRVRSGAREVEVVVDEDAVRNGARVVAPSLAD